MQTITEATATISISDEKKLSRKTEVFYNPVMKANRDISIAILNAWDKDHLQIADPFAASGIRSIRFLKELPTEKIKTIVMNDYSEKAIEYIKENLSLNFPQKSLMNAVNVEIFCTEASLFLLKSNGFNYIDIDPFGTPVPFLDAACKRLSRDGILAVTATDTSALAGVFPDACRRKYGAIPLHGPIMHEVGLRILIKKCQEIGAQYEKALTPIFSYAKDHYYRIFFQAEKGRTKADRILRQHGMMDGAGPLWLGRLWDEEFLKKMKTGQQETKKFLDIIKKEAMIPAIGFYDIHAICKKNHLEIPKYEPLLAAIEKKGYAVARTHFSLNGIRTLMGENEFIEAIKEMLRNSTSPFPSIF